MLQGADISIDLNSDTFILADSQELADRLRAETDLRVQSEVAAFTGVEGGPPPPDVVIWILYTLLPLRDIYAGMLSSIIWDATKPAFSRQGKEVSEATFSLVKTNEEGHVLGEVSGKTSDPEMIKELIRRMSDED